MKRILYFYGLFLLVFTLLTYLFIDRNLFYMHFMYSDFYSRSKPLVTFIFLLFIVGWFSFYLTFLRMKDISLMHVKKIIGVSILCLIFSYPAVSSYDVFNYLTTARVTFFYHENPYLVMPIEFEGDPMLLYTRAANKFALYGPTWILISGMPQILSFGNFYIQMTLLKVMIGVFYLGVCFVIYRLSKDAKSMIFFALNPLVLFETFVGTHNDIVMIFLALTSFYFLKQKRFFISILLLILSIFVKYSTILLLPIFFSVLWNYERRLVVNWNKIWLYSSLLMFLAFLLGVMREELYPWYAIWFIAFVALLKGYDWANKITICISVGLVLSYTPYMFLGHYLFPEQLVKNTIILLSFIIGIFWVGYASLIQLHKK